jgi:hypothetical protein
MAAATTTILPIRSEHGRFYVWMAGAFVLIAFGGFAPSYWSKIASGSFQGPAILHVHGLLFFGWTLFYFIQAALVAAGRTVRHRAWGMAGIALFSVMICSVVVTQISVMKLNDLRGFGDAGRRFAAAALCLVALLSGLFALAIANVRRPEVHKRLMLMLMTCCMAAPIARIFMVLLAPAGGTGGPPPISLAISTDLMANTLIVVAMIYDWRSIGRIHPVYVYGGLAVLAVELLIAPLSAADGWMAFARAIEGLAG